MGFDYKALSTEDLDRLLQEAGEERRARAGNQSDDLPGTIPGTFDPRYWVHRVDNEALLFLRDRGFGWIFFKFPRHEAEAVAGLLLEYSKPGPSTIGAIATRSGDPDEPSPA